MFRIFVNIFITRSCYNSNQIYRVSISPLFKYTSELNCSSVITSAIRRGRKPVDDSPQPEREDSPPLGDVLDNYPVMTVNDSATLDVPLVDGSLASFAPSDLTSKTFDLFCRKSSTGHYRQALYVCLARAYQFVPRDRTEEVSGVSFVTTDFKIMNSPVQKGFIISTHSLSNSNPAAFLDRLTKDTSIPGVFVFEFQFSNKKSPLVGVYSAFQVRDTVSRALRSSSKARKSEVPSDLQAQLQGQLQGQLQDQDEGGLDG
jgi:hypothetical protein